MEEARRRLEADRPDGAEEEPCGLFGGGGLLGSLAGESRRQEEHEGEKCRWQRGFRHGETPYTPCMNAFGGTGVPKYLSRQ